MMKKKIRTMTTDPSRRRQAVDKDLADALRLSLLERNQKKP
jgi:hypothetical protein